MTHTDVREDPQDAVQRLVRRLWGHDTLRPLQHDAIFADLAGRDSLLVMATGGGKSLCYQAPAILRHELGEPGTTLVVSPLVALMDDQVASLRAMGVDAVAMHSGNEELERQEQLRLLDRGRVPLVFVAPERALRPGFLRGMAAIGVRSLCIDEAHCISQWGHEFRPEYRRLAELRQAFPGVAMHAFTATATHQVGRDIAAQLQLHEPLLLRGPVHRPNLLIRTRHRLDGPAQCLECIRRHAGEAGIVYCLSRADAERTQAALQREGIRAGVYHAGLSTTARKRAHEDFRAERIDVMVATVAFGMGVDRGDVRFVIHMTLPRSVEHWVQEAGRAGRDGLPSEVLLLHAAGDVTRWERLMDRDHGASDDLAARVAAEAHRTSQRGQLQAMRSIVTQDRCRHAVIGEHFGQPWTLGPCGACDVCLGEWQPLADATHVARVSLSAVARVEQRFGARHVAAILAGSGSRTLHRWGHADLTVFGMLRHLPRAVILQVLEQLVEQGLLQRCGEEQPVLQLTPSALPVLRGDRAVTLRTTPVHARRSAAEVAGWGDVDRSLVERLRTLRRDLARDRGIPPFMVFSDVTLRAMAAQRPTHAAALLRIPGLGERRVAAYGARLLEALGSEAGSGSPSSSSSSMASAAEA
ncbi:MAG: RecQ family ATP-dependent DNA helicase [Phycisphaerales bacterium]|jgi:ATP-dependent DNA helicase RecQ